MKKLLVSLLVLAVALSCVFAVTVSAEDIIDGNTYTAVCGEGSNWTWDAEALTLTYTNAESDSWTFTFTLKNNALTWTAYADNNADTLDDIIIPSYVQVDDSTTYAVTTINKGAANGKATIKSIVIYDGITSVGGSVFENCTVLESIKFPSTVTAIGDYCFKQCYALNNVDFKDTQVKSLGRDMFYKCSALTSIELPSTLETLGQGVFSACSALADIELPATLKTVGNTSFASSAITSITIPASVTTINTYAFQKCTALTEAYILSEGLTAIPEGLFNGCSALATVEYPATVNSFGKSSFNGCSALSSIDLTNITSLGANCFQGAGLTTVTVPATLTNIGNAAFYRCSKLVSAYIYSEGLTALPESMFNECTKLKTLVIPETVTSYGKTAFYKVGLDEVPLTGITSVGDSCFQWYNPKAKGFVIPAELTNISKLAFQSNDITYMIFEGKTAPTFGGTAGDPRNNGQGLRNDAKGTGKVYVPANSTGYEEAFENYFTTSKMTLEYFGVRITGIAASDAGYTVSYTYNDLEYIKNKDTSYQDDKIMVALYNGDGALVAVKTVSATETSADIETDETIASAKIFAFDSLTSLAPLYEAHEYTLAQ